MDVRGGRRAGQSGEIDASSQRASGGVDLDDRCAGPWRVVRRGFRCSIKRSCEFKRRRGCRLYMRGDYCQQRHPNGNLVHGGYVASEIEAHRFHVAFSWAATWSVSNECAVTPKPPSDRAFGLAWLLTALRGGHRGSPERRAPAARSAPLCQQTPAAGDRERPLRGQKTHAAESEAFNPLHGAVDDSGARSHAVVAEGFRLCGRPDGMRAEAADVGLLRSPGGY